jgi:hypothetical protein
MSGGPYPPTAPQQPIAGGRDSSGMHTRAARRLEARAAIERRQTGARDLSDVPSLMTPTFVDLITDERPAGSFATRLQSALGAALRRSGRGSRR